MGSFAVGVQRAVVGDGSEGAKIPGPVPVPGRAGENGQGGACPGVQKSGVVDGGEGRRETCGCRDGGTGDVQSARPAEAAPGVEGVRAAVKIYRSRRRERAAVGQVAAGGEGDRSAGIHRDRAAAFVGERLREGHVGAGCAALDDVAAALVHDGDGAVVAGGVVADEVERAVVGQGLPAASLVDKAVVPVDGLACVVGDVGGGVMGSCAVGVQRAVVGDAARSGKSAACPIHGSLI